MYDVVLLNRNDYLSKLSKFINPYMSINQKIVLNSLEKP